MTVENYISVFSNMDLTPGFSVSSWRDFITGYLVGSGKTFEESEEIAAVILRTNWGKSVLASMRDE